MTMAIENGVRSPCAGTVGPATVSLEPASAYEAVTRQMVIAMNEELVNRLASALSR